MLPEQNGSNFKPPVRYFLKCAGRFDPQRLQYTGGEADAQNRSVRTLDPNLRVLAGCQRVLLSWPSTPVCYNLAPETTSQ
jgi:hypothetical protein